MGIEDRSGCQHITSRIRAVSVHSGMQVGARESPTGDLWWCVGCGGLFADDDGTNALAMPTSAEELKRWRDAQDGSPPDGDVAAVGEETPQ
jgi:hypothetical protein